MARTADLLRQFTSLLKLLLAVRRLAKTTWVRLLREAALILRIFYARFVTAGPYRNWRGATTLGDRKEPGTPSKPPSRISTPTDPVSSTTTTTSEKPVPTATDHSITTTTTPTSKTFVDRDKSPTNRTTPPDLTTGTLTLTTYDANIKDKEVTPLDSTIACSLRPYPSLQNLSGSSLKESRDAARSSHTHAVSVRSAGRSSPYLAGSPSRTHSPSGTHSLHGDEPWTFQLEAPESPQSQRGEGSRDCHPSSHQASSGSESLANRDQTTLEDEASLPHAGNTGYDATLTIRLPRTPSPPSMESMYGVARPVGASGPPPSTGTHHSASSYVPRLSHGRIFPLVPGFFRRYERHVFAKERDTKMVIEALTLDFCPSDPPGWTPIVHPEGILYFYHDEKKAVTEADLYNREYYDHIMADIETLENHVDSNRIELPKRYTLSMDIERDAETGVLYTDYYFVDHDRRIVFFLDDLQAEKNLPVWNEVKGVTSLRHVRHELEAQYWTHGVLYCSTVEVTDELVCDLRDLILHYIADFTTSPYSTSPYNASDLNRMLKQVNSLRRNTGSRNHGASSFLCRMMVDFSRQRYYNWHGCPEARIYRNQSVYGKKRRKTLLIKVVSPLLFSAPDVHLKALEMMWVDGIMHNAVWLASIKKLNEEWTEFTLYATVLLNANVGFLAIQSIDSLQAGYRSPTQIASYMSIVSSIGSVITGLLLLRQNRTREQSTAEEVNKFLKARSHPSFGLETLAILYSLPYALLLWGMVSFLAAFACNCFDTTSSVLTRGIMGAAWAAFTVLVIWCIWMGWVEIERSDVPGIKDEDDASAVSSQKAPSQTRMPDAASGSPVGSGHGDAGGGLGGVIQNLIGPLWKLLRRESYDSQRTAV